MKFNFKSILNVMDLNWALGVCIYNQYMSCCCLCYFPPPLPPQENTGVSLPQLRASGAVHLIGICFRPDDEYTPSSSCRDIPKSLIFKMLLSPTKQFLAARSLLEKKKDSIFLHISKYLKPVENVGPLSQDSGTSWKVFLRVKSAAKQLWKR